MAVLIALVTGPGALLAQTSNQVVTVGYTDSRVAPSLPVVAPGSIITLFTSDLNVPDAIASQKPLPRSLSGVTVLVRVAGAISTAGYPPSLPILRLHTIHSSFSNVNGMPCATTRDLPCSHSEITVQIPSERVCAQPVGAPQRTCADPARFEDFPPLLVLNVEANGRTGPDLHLRMALAEPHLLTGCDSIFGPKSGLLSCVPLVTHADGSIVDEEHPAGFGEIITLYAVGLGSNVPTGEATQEPAPPVGFCCTVITFRSRMQLADPASGHPWAISTDTEVRPEYVGLVTGYVGLFQVNVQVPPPLSGSVPATLSACAASGNTSITVGSPLTSAVSICVR